MTGNHGVCILHEAETMRYFEKLKVKDILSLIGLVIIGLSWMMIDQLFLKQSGQRFVVFSLIMVILFYFLYWINKPQKIWYYANSIALTLLIFVIILSIVIHVIIKHDFVKVLRHLLLLWLIVGVIPYLAGFIYSRISRK